MNEDEMKLSPEERWILVRRRFQAMPLDLFSREIWGLEKKGNELDRIFSRSRIQFWIASVGIALALLVFGFCAVFSMLLSMGLPQILATLGGLVWLIVLLMATTDWTLGAWLVKQEAKKNEFESLIASNRGRIELARDAFKSKTKPGVK